MAYKINGTTVVDNSRNVCACCVTSCCITASNRMDAPSGTTAQRPSSPATGSIYFDTDLGSLISYNGTTWNAVGGSSVGLGVSSGLVNSPSDAWSATYLNAAPSTQCRGLNNSCMANDGFCNLQICKCLPYYKCEYEAEVCWAGQWKYPWNCSCAVLTRSWCVLSKQGTPLCYGCHGYQSLFCGDHTCVVSIPSYCCQGIAWEFFEDGSICHTNFDQTPTGAVSCGCTVSVTSIHFDKYGNNFLYTNFHVTPSVCTTSPNWVPENSLFYMNFIGRGVNGPIAPLRNCLDSYLESPLVHKVGCTCYVFEVCTDYISSFGYEVCDIARAWCSPFNSTCMPLEKLNQMGGAHFKRQTGIDIAGVCPRFLSSTIVGGTTVCCPPCAMRQWSYISKCPSYDKTSPSAYIAKEGTCSPSGLKVGFSYEAACNSIAYLRMLDWNCCYRQGGLYNFCCGQGVYWSSKDNCCMFHVYFPDQDCGSGWNCFTCSTLCSLSTGVRVNGSNPYPALEVINTTNGCVICSIYWLGWYDCQVAGAEYNKAVFGTRNWFGTAPLTYRQAPRDKHKRRNVFSENTSSVDGYPMCAIRSCNCPGIIYFLPYNQNGCRSSRFSIFDECNLKFVGVQPVTLLHSQCLCTKTKCLLGGVQGIYLASGTAYNCLSCAYCCTYDTTTTTPRRVCSLWTTLTGGCLGTTSACCDLRFDFPTPCLSDPYCFGDTYYINPETDHLVTFYSLAYCSGTLASTTKWIGAVCWDIWNCCITRVETLWPTSGEKCIAGLCCGLCCWGTLNWTDANGCLKAAGNFCMCTNTCNSGPYIKKRVAMVGRTYGDSLSEGGFSYIVTPNVGAADGMAILSSCRICNCPGGACGTCLTCGTCMGYFGPCQIGGCVYRNTCCFTNCKEGLNRVNPSFGVGRVPYSKPLKCTEMFEEDAGVKCFIEMVLGCHDIGCALYCNNQCQIDKEVYSYFAPCFYCTVDITCQFSLGCPNVYTWGGTCWCSACRWQIWDTSTTCVCYCRFTWTGTPTNCCETMLDMVGFDCCCGFCCFKVNCVDAGSCYTCCNLANCCACLTCENYAAVPTALICICTENLFRGVADHRRFTNPSGEVRIIGYDTGGSREANCFIPDSCGRIRHSGHDNYFSNLCQPCCCLKGISGPVKYWFDKYYAEIL